MTEEQMIYAKTDTGERTLASFSAQAYRRRSTVMPQIIAGSLDGSSSEMAVFSPSPTRRGHRQPRAGESMSNIVVISGRISDYGVKFGRSRAGNGK